MPVLYSLVAILLAVCVPRMARADLRIIYHTAAEELLLLGSDGRHVFVRDSIESKVVPTEGRWILAGSLRDAADRIFWCPDYAIRRELAPDAESDQKTPVAVRIYLRHGRSLNSEGKLDDGHLIAYWPGQIKQPAAAVFLWVVDDEVTEIEVQPLHAAEDYLNFTLKAQRLFSREDAARCRVGVAIVIDGEIRGPKKVFSETDTPSMWEALIWDDSISFDHALAAGARIGAESTSGQTLPFIAAQSGATEVLKRMLTIDPQLVFAINDKGETLLHLASFYGRTGAAELLLKQGAKVNTRCNRGLSPLMVAAIYGHLEMVRLLADAGADLAEEQVGIPVNLQDAAFESGDLGLVVYLANKGVRLPPTSRIDFHLLNASRRGLCKLSAWLLDKGGKNITKATKSRALLNAAEYSTDPSIISLLISAGADVEGKDHQGNSPLLLACRRGQLNMARALLETGADVNARNLEGNTAMHLVADRNDQALTALLLERGADLRLRNRAGYTPLAIALLGNSPLSARLLVDAGDHIDLTDVRSQTLLLSAIRLDLDGLIRSAMQTGWSPASTSFEGWSALEVAGIFDAKRVADLFESAGVPAAGDRVVRKSALSSNPKPVSQRAIVDPRETDNQSPFVVRVKCVVDERGRVMFPRFVDRPEGSNLAGVLASVSEWRFTPATREGRAVAVSVELPVLIRPDASEVARLSEVDEFPSLRKRVDPVYPRRDPSAKDPGGALVVVTVDKDGNVQEARVAGDQRSPFVSAALQSVRLWKFSPAKQNGIPVPVELEVLFSWKDRP